MITSSATNNPSPKNRQIIVYRTLAAVMPILLIIVNGLILKTSVGNIAQLQTSRAEIVTKNQAIEEAISFNNYLKSHQIALEKMSVALPNQSMLVGVIQDIESVIRIFDPSASVKFAAVTPMKQNQDLIVPMTITIHSPLEQLPQIYQELMKLPYLLQLISSESKLTDTGADTTIILRLYVQDPFTGY